MKKRVFFLLLIFGIVVISYYSYVRFPIFTGEITKQTLYISLLNYFHEQDCMVDAHFMLIDDDSGDGIFAIHEICERVGVKATFAVVPAWLDSIRCDSLKKWSEEGYGIALHGYDHGRWKEWTKEEILADIDRSLSFLSRKGFNINKISLVVTPGFYNTRAIRSAIASKGMKMIMGANIINPDTSTFQWGRLFIKKETDIDDTRGVLLRAKRKKGFVVLGTHSSLLDEFSEEKTEIILRMALDIGLKEFK